jgi:hypothetical protein
VISMSIVPTGLVLNRMPNPGTEVPGYFHLVPTGRKVPGYFPRVPMGRKMAKLQRAFGPHKSLLQDTGKTGPTPETIFRFRPCL